MNHYHYSQSGNITLQHSQHTHIEYLDKYLLSTHRWANTTYYILSFIWNRRNWIFVGCPMVRHCSLLRLSFVDLPQIRNIYCRIKEQKQKKTKKNRPFTTRCILFAANISSLADKAKMKYNLLARAIAQQHIYYTSKTPCQRYQLQNTETKINYD